MNFAVGLFCFSMLKSSFVVVVVVVLLAVSITGCFVQMRCGLGMRTVPRHGDISLCGAGTRNTSEQSRSKRPSGSVGNALPGGHVFFLVVHGWFLRPRVLFGP